MVTLRPNTTVAAVVVAAGSGSRFGGDLPKQFLTLAGRPVLRHSLDTMRRAVPGIRIVLVLSPSGRDIWADYSRRTGYESPQVVEGGATRAESVLRGLEALDAAGVPADAVVLVHDGARPFVTEAMIGALVGAVEGGAGAAAPAVPVTDSVLAASGALGTDTVDRASLRAVQTPQTFRLADITEAHRRHDTTRRGAPTDECAAYIHHFGSPVTLVEGSPDNIKITNPRDLAIAELICAATSNM